MKKILFKILIFLLIYSYQVSYSQSLVDTPYHELQNEIDSLDTNEEDSIEEDNEEAEEGVDSSTLRTISDNNWQKIKEDKAFVYKKEKEKPKKKSSVDIKPLVGISDFLGGVFFKAIMFLIVGILLVIIIYHLFFTGENGYWKSRKSKKSTSFETSFENIEVFSEWDLALKEALINKDYRLAVRVLYLETLQIMNRNGWIEFEQEKTNWDYVQKLSSTIHHKVFSALTIYFDYIWYGHFNIDQDRYQLIETKFRNFQNEIR
ncbi:MAG TPA: hypothetical protein PLU17_03100 [Chitinophagaceae bacterium]|nr:hypothetical protein [Chitinophagaceae bacterium]